MYERSMNRGINKNYRSTIRPIPSGVYDSDNPLHFIGFESPKADNEISAYDIFWLCNDRFGSPSVAIKCEVDDPYSMYSDGWKIINFYFNDLYSTQSLNLGETVVVSLNKGSHFFMISLDGQYSSSEFPYKDY